MTGKHLYIIAGCNGAGKTTASYTFLPEILLCKEFVNADEIAKGLSPFQPEKVAIEAGRIMIHRINSLLKDGESFAFETTLATKSYKRKILDARSNGYYVILVYFWLNNIELAKKRVEQRVSEGGHNIQSDVIERRYLNGIKNLFDIYLPIVDEAQIVDNSDGVSELFAHCESGVIKVINQKKFDEIREYYDEK